MALFLYAFDCFLHSAEALLLLKDFCDTHLMYSYILTPQHCANLMELHTRVRNFLLLLFRVISLRLTTNKKQLCLIQLGNQNFYDTLDTNRCSIYILPMNE